MEAKVDLVGAIIKFLNFSLGGDFKKLETFTLTSSVQTRCLYRTDKALSPKWCSEGRCIGLETDKFKSRGK